MSEQTVESKESEKIRKQVEGGATGWHTVACECGAKVKVFLKAEKRDGKLGVAYQIYESHTCKACGKSFRGAILIAIIPVDQPKEAVGAKQKVRVDGAKRDYPRQELLKGSSCQNTIWMPDGYCPICGKNHYGGEREPQSNGAPLTEKPKHRKVRELAGENYRPLWGWQATIGSEDLEGRE